MTKGALEILRAFSRDWERLGAPAKRLGLPSGQRLILWSRRFKQAGLIESYMGGDCLRWRLTGLGIMRIASELNKRKLAEQSA